MIKTSLDWSISAHTHTHPTPRSNLSESAPVWSLNNLLINLQAGKGKGVQCSIGLGTSYCP